MSKKHQTIEEKLAFIEKKIDKVLKNQEEMKRSGIFLPPNTPVTPACPPPYPMSPDPIYPYFPQHPHPFYCATAAGEEKPITHDETGGPLQ